MQGRIVKEIGGLFYIENNEKKILESRARGKIKYFASKICVGDIVEYSLIQNECIINRFLDRKNILLRPPIANIDQIVVVLSSSPYPDFLLVDKMIINSIVNDIDFVLCVNKSDILDKIFLDFVLSNYKNVVDNIVVMSAVTSEGLSNLKSVLNDRVSVLAGQSAVGKSSIANLLIGKNSLKTDVMSHKIMRGKHTTRHCELLTLDDGGYIVDTPGFTFFDGIKDIRPSELQSYYGDFEPHINKCKFKGCMHVNEPICGVKCAVSNNDIDKSRYDRYVELYKQQKNKWDNMY